MIYCRLAVVVSSFENKIWLICISDLLNLIYTWLYSNGFILNENARVLQGRQILNVIECFLH